MDRVKMSTTYRRRMREATALYDGGLDEPSFNDIYGEEGLPLEGDDVGTDNGSITITLTSEQAEALKAIVAMLPGVEENPVSVPGTDTLDDTTPIMERARKAYRGHGL